METVVIVGRPNVGKSTLFNRIVGRREAIVEHKSGVTRDRKEETAEWVGTEFNLVDTGGWMAKGDELADKVSDQAVKAIKNAAVILFVVDAEVGITVDDEQVANLLRPYADRVILVANKSDDFEKESAIWEFLSLGLGDPVAVAAQAGRNSGDLLDEVIRRLPKDDKAETIEETEIDENLISVVIAGRPNVGKSTLFNRIIGEERSIVHDMPGTTRDVIDTVLETGDGSLRILDTAGMRRKSRVDEDTEFYSVMRALKAIDRADISIYVIDAVEGVTHQDQRLVERIDGAGCPIVIALNKWELLDAEKRRQAEEDIGDRLAFLSYSPVLKISAKSGMGVHKLLPAIDEAITNYTKRVSTRELNTVLEKAQAAHPSPQGRVLYATQGATDPPTFTLFTTRTMQQTYLRYLERKLREHFGFETTPIKLRVRRRAS